MIKKLSIILAILLIVPTVCVGASADDVWTYNFVVGGREVTVTSEEKIDRYTAYMAAYNFARYYIYGNDPYNDSSYSGSYYSEYSLSFTSGHRYVTVTTTTVSHKYYANAPRCVEYIEKMRICRDCGYTYKILLDSNRIFCCGSDVSPFDDVAKNAWYYDAVCSCHSAGYMSGTSNRRFSPGGKLTRAMFVVILSKIDGVKLDSYSGKTNYRDVPADEWYSKAVRWATDNGYTQGVGGGVFGVNNAVTREQLAVFLYTYTRKKGYSIAGLADINKYTDRNKISDWAVTGVRWAMGAGLISGTSSNTVSPKKSATRAEVAVIVMKYVNNVKGK